jgi:hypothetical protein
MLLGLLRWWTIRLRNTPDKLIKAVPAQLAMLKHSRLLL